MFCATCGGMYGHLMGCTLGAAAPLGEPKPMTCLCPIADLMAGGCKCGAFLEEQACARLAANQNEAAPEKDGWTYGYQSYR